MTPFTDIYSLAKITIIDYKVDSLIKIDYEAFLTYFRSLLTVGIPEFVGCLKSLDYTTREEVENYIDKDGNMAQRNVVNWYFIEDLDIHEKGILAKIVVLKWWESKIQDVVAFQPHLSVKDFKQLQESQSLKQKSEYQDKLRENLSKAIGDYQLEHLSSLPFFGG